MPVVATPTTPVIVTIDQVRRFMQDYPNKNILLDAVDFTQDDINQGIEMITSKYNTLTPQSQILPASWPTHLQYLLLLGVTAYLAQSSALLQLRNHATYQDGDIAPIGIDDKYTQYLSLYQHLNAEWTQMAQQVKLQNNLESIYGKLGSGYANTGRFRYS